MTHMGDDAGDLSWWVDPETDWTRGDPGRVADLLAAAYPDTALIRGLAESAGIDGSGTPVAVPAREAWALVLARAARAERVLDVMAEVLQDGATEVFHPPLRSMLGGHLGLVNGRRSLKFGLDERSADGTDPVVTSLCEVPSQAGDEPVTGLQAITSLPDGLEDPRALVQGLLDAMQRTAMIEVSGIPRGTGFLVGPDLVLTAAHVVDARRWPPEPRPEVSARFDYAPQQGRSQAESGVEVPVAEFVTGSLPTAAEIAANVVDWNAPADRLDFALLRLGFPVPPVEAEGVARPRGDYALATTDYDFAGSPILLIVQHPLGGFQRVSFIRAAAEPNAAGTRVRYRGNTLAGSSGSAVIDSRGRLVALHHYSGRGKNQGVPVSAIARMLAGGGFSVLFTPSAGRLVATGGGPSVELDPFVTTSFTGRPFVNRGSLRGHIRKMAAGQDGGRLLTIRGESGSGMSYSYMLLSHIAGRSKACPSLREAAPDGLAAIPLDLADYVVFDVDERAERIMHDLFDELGLPHTQEPLAQTARYASTLSRQLRRGLRDSRRQWWIFLDGVDEAVAIKQGGLDEAISALAIAASDPQVPLRLVLVGRQAAKFAADHDLITEEDTAAGLVRSDVEAWFRARAGEERRVIDEDRLARTLTELFPLDGPLPAPCSLAPRLPKRLLEVLEDHDGS